MVFGAFGFDPFLIGPSATVPLPVLLAAGAVQGVILALAVTRAENTGTRAEAPGEPGTSETGGSVARTT